MNTNIVPIPRDILEAPFPSELIKSRPGSFGQSLNYLEGHTVLGRLNEAFEGSWSFEIVSHQILEEEVLVLGKFRAEPAGVVKMAWGSSKITRNDRTGQQVSIGDDLKAAATDALKKSATLLGVGLSLYGNQAADSDGPTSGDRREDPGNGRNIRNGSQPATGNGSEANGRITSRQLSAIFAIARERKMSNQDVRNLAKEMYSKNIDYLAKSEASSLIDHLLAQLFPQSSPTLISGGGPGGRTCACPAASAKEVLHARHDPGSAAVGPAYLGQ